MESAEAQYLWVCNYRIWRYRNNSKSFLNKKFNNNEYYDDDKYNLYIFYIN